MYVWYDGTVNPCDFDYKSYLKVGNVKNSSLSSICRGNNYGKLRRYHLNDQRHKLYPCDRCDLD